MRIVRNPDGSYINSGPLAGLHRFWDPDNHLPCGADALGPAGGGERQHRRDRLALDARGHRQSCPEASAIRGGLAWAEPSSPASGLIFIGATDDARFRAFETKTGKEIWTVKLPASAEATPITYRGANGKQYVAVVATGGGLIGAQLASDSVIAYALPLSGAMSTMRRFRKPRGRRCGAVPLAFLALAGVGLLADAANAAQAPAAQTPAAQPPVPAPPAGASALPPGPGRDVVMRVCSACHSPEIIATQRHDAQGWAEVVQLMASRGANASEDEFNEIIDYLATSFPAPSSTPGPAQGAHPPST